MGLRWERGGRLPSTAHPLSHHMAGVAWGLLAPGQSPLRTPLPRARGEKSELLVVPLPCPQLPPLTDTLAGPGTLTALLDEKGWPASEPRAHAGDRLQNSALNRATWHSKGHNLGGLNGTSAADL